MPSKANRQDVAAAAGVSGATVSRVYNHPSLVGKDTVRRVREAAEQLGFVPDRHAAALRRRSSGTLLFVEIESDLGYRWPSQRAYQSLYGEIIRAVLHAAQGTALPLQLVTLADAGRISDLERRDFAGILGFDVSEPATAKALAALGRPVVCAHHGDHLSGVSTVTTDNRAGGALQAQYLKETGHRSVAYVTGMRSEVRSHQLRWEGFSRALEPTVTMDGAVGYAEGLRAGRQLAGDVDSGRITAVACVNDLTALGVARGLSDEGVDLPREALVGYDNLYFTGLVGRGFPTVEAGLPTLYVRALAVLIALVNGGSNVQERLSPSLIP